MTASTKPQWQNKAFVSTMPVPRPSEMTNVSSLRGLLD